MSLLDAPTRPTIALVIHGTRAADPGLRAAVDAARRRGVRVRPRVTYEQGDAATFAREEADAGADAVVAAGGDGTLNEVLNGLTGRDVPLGLIPLGTANDFARQAGIPEDAAHALDLILTRPPVRLDTAELNVKTQESQIKSSPAAASRRRPPPTPATRPRPRSAPWPTRSPP